MYLLDQGNHVLGSCTPIGKSAEAAAAVDGFAGGKQARDHGAFGVEHLAFFFGHDAADGDVRNRRLRGGLEGRFHDLGTICKRGASEQLIVIGRTCLIVLDDRSFKRCRIHAKRLSQLGNGIAAVQRTVLDCLGNGFFGFCSQAAVDVVGDEISRAFEAGTFCGS